MSKIINCKTCGVLLMEIKDGKVRKDVVCYCAKCDDKDDKSPQLTPDWLGSIFGNSNFGKK